MSDALVAPVTVLLIEDNELHRDMLSRRLSRRGFEVLLAVDGADGLMRARQETPALVLLEMSLPMVDGLEVTRRLKATSETRDIPVVMLTSHALAEDRERALDAGCDDFDTKPIDLPRLLGKMDALLAARGRP